MISLAARLAVLPPRFRNHFAASRVKLQSASAALTAALEAKRLGQQPPEGVSLPKLINDFKDETKRLAMYTDVVMRDPNQPHTLAQLMADVVTRDAAHPCS